MISDINEKARSIKKINGTPYFLSHNAAGGLWICSEVWDYDGSIHYHRDSNHEILIVGKDIEEISTGGLEIAVTANSSKLGFEIVSAARNFAGLVGARYVSLKRYDGRSWKEVERRILNGDDILALISPQLFRLKMDSDYAGDSPVGPVKTSRL